MTQLKKLDSFRRINLSFIVLLSFALILDVIKALQKEESVLHAAAGLIPILAVFLVLFIVLQIRGRRPFSFFLQVFILAALSIYTIAYEGVNSTGVPLLIMRVFYFIHEKKRMDRLFFVVLFLFALVYVSALSFNAFVIQKDGRIMAASLVLSMTTIFLYWTVFEDDLSKALKKIQDDQVYTDMGRNSGLLFHNMKNDLVMLENYLNLMEETDNFEAYLEAMKLAMGNMQDKLQRMKENLVYSHAREEQVIDLRSLGASVVELFRLDRRMNTFCDLVFNPGPEAVMVRTSPMEIRDALVNLVTNALDALERQSRGAKSELAVNVFIQGGRAVMQVVDRAGGLSGCRGVACQSHTCLYCNIFQAGRTSTPHGSGQGLLDVMQVTHSHKGDLSFYTVPGEGTRVNVYLPLWTEGADTTVF